jgi:hypothetical protein
MNCTYVPNAAAYVSDVKSAAVSRVTLNSIKSTTENTQGVRGRTGAQNIDGGAGKAVSFSFHAGSHGAQRARRIVWPTQMPTAAERSRA